MVLSRLADVKKGKRVFLAFQWPSLSLSTLTPCANPVD
jgi:hypothetical protein